MESFQKLLFSHMEEAGLTCAALGRIVGLSEPYVAQIRKGTRPPPEQAIESIAAALKLEGENRDYFLEMAAIARVKDPGLQQHLIKVLNQLFASSREAERMRKVLREAAGDLSADSSAPDLPRGTS